MTAARGTAPPALRSMLLFGVVGSIGFLVDTGVLLLAVRYAGIGPLAGRIVSFLCAATITFCLNRRYTFAATAGSARGQWLRYVLATGLGAVINIGLFYAWISLAGRQPVHLVVGSAIGSLVAMAFNYVVSRTMVFAPGPPERP